MPMAICGRYNFVTCLLIQITYGLYFYSSSCNISEGKTYAKHEKYVTTVAFMKPNDVFTTGLILTGCNDNLIRAFVENRVDPVLSLHGHTDAGLKYAYLS